MTETSSTTPAIRVVLADDHDILRQGLKLLLGLRPEIEVAGEARTGLEAVEMAQPLPSKRTSSPTTNRSRSPTTSPCATAAG